MISCGSQAWLGGLVKHGKVRYPKLKYTSGPQNMPDSPDSVSVRNPYFIKGELLLLELLLGMLLKSCCVGPVCAHLPCGGDQCSQVRQDGPPGGGVFVDERVRQCVWEHLAVVSRPWAILRGPR